MSRPTHPRDKWSGPSVILLNVRSMLATVLIKLRALLRRRRCVHCRQWFEPWSRFDRFCSDECATTDYEQVQA